MGVKENQKLLSHYNQQSFEDINSKTDFFATKSQYGKTFSKFFSTTSKSTGNVMSDNFRGSNNFHIKSNMFRTMKTSKEETVNFDKTYDKEEIHPNEKVNNDLAIVMHVEDWINKKMNINKKFNTIFKKTDEESLAHNHRSYKTRDKDDIHFKSSQSRAPYVNTNMIDLILRETDKDTKEEPRVKLPTRGVVSNIESLNGKFNQEIMEGLIKTRIAKDFNFTEENLRNVDIESNTIKMIGSEFKSKFKSLGNNANINIGELYKKIEDDIPTY